MQPWRWLAVLTVLAASVTHAGAQEPNPVVVIDTSMGKVKVELFADKAPGTVRNFLQYADDKFYDGTIFHRVIPDFMVQGGGFNKEMKRKETREPIKNEAGNKLSNKRGTLAMARTGDPDSASSQFFINVADNTPLDRDPANGNAGYAVFGRVIDGMDVVDKIRQVETHTVKVPVEVERFGQKRVIDVPFADVPVEPVVIRSVRREKQ